MRKIPRRRRRPRVAVDPLAVLSGALAERWDRFVREVVRARRTPTEPAIHDLRVALRRLLAVMSAVESVLPGGYFRRPRGELRTHLRNFNGLRDVQVQLLAVRGLKRRFPVLVRYEAILRKEQLVHIRALRVEVRGIRQESFLRSLARAQTALANLYGTPAASRALQVMLAGSAAAAFAKVLDRRAGLVPQDPRSVHRMRVAFKKFRYTVELSRPFLPWAGREHGRAMDAFQTALGEIQDLEVLAAGLRRFAGREPRSPVLQFLPLFQFLSSFRAAKLSTLLRSVDRLESFWR